MAPRRGLQTPIWPAAERCPPVGMSLGTNRTYVPRVPGCCRVWVAAGGVVRVMRWRGRRRCRGRRRGQWRQGWCGGDAVGGHQVVGDLASRADSQRGERRSWRTGERSDRDLAGQSDRQGVGGVGSSPIGRVGCRQGSFTRWQLGQLLACRRRQRTRAWRRRLLVPVQVDRGCGRREVGAVGENAAVHGDGEVVAAVLFFDSFHEHNAAWKGMVES